ncbi:MAG: UDP-N-acetylmuramate--L-alanine ligase [Chlamydiota bacterium]
MTKKCHFIGIGGIGMSGLARMLLENQSVVTGSDLRSNSLIEELQTKGAKVNIGHDPKFVTPESTIVYSTGITKDNPEYRAAVEMNCPMLHRSDLLKALIGDSQLLGVSGTHGKTTTSSLLAHVLIESQMDPSYSVGGVMLQRGLNAGKGEGKYFVAELDESDGSFTKFFPHGAIITSIGSDHIDHYGSKDQLIGSFKQFVDQVDNEDHLFWCGDNMYLKAMSPKGASFGFCESCDLRAVNYEQNGWSLSYDIHFRDKVYPNVTLPLIGAHNALNSLAVFGLSLSIGIDEGVIRKAFDSFEGVKRRCEKKGEECGVMVIDDYAHHPTEISFTLNAIRQAVEERRIFVVFQPHRYSRTRDCLGEFGGVFDEADEVIITDIYGAGESPIPGISHEDIIEENEQISDVPFRHMTEDEIIPNLLNELRPHDVVVTFGAGNITNFSKQLVDVLKKKGSLL